MRIVFSFAGLLVVVAALLYLARTQLDVLTGSTPPRPAAGAAAGSPGAVPLPPPVAPRDAPAQVRSEIERAFDAAAQRASDASR